MQRFFILRLDKDLRSSLERQRTNLYKKSGDSSFFTFEPLIIIGAAEQSAPSFIPCPPLPIQTKPIRYEHGTLYIPIDDATLAPIREACNTRWPTSGIYLGDIDLSVDIETFQITYLRFGILSVQKVNEIFRWQISEERSLGLGKDGR